MTRARTLTLPAVVLHAAASVMVPGCDCGLHAEYRSESVQLEGVDYPAVLDAARAAGYTVDGPYYVNAKQPCGVHPDDMPELEDRLGGDFRACWIVLYYSPSLFMEVTVPGPLFGEATEITFFDWGDRPEGPFLIESLPPDAWVIDQLVLVLGIDEQRAAAYLDALKERLAEERPDVARITAPEPARVAAIRAALVAASTRTAGSDTGGDGWYKETFYAGADALGSIDLIVQSSRILHRRRGAEYEIKLDLLGGMYLLVSLGAGDTLAEDEYRGVFEEMLGRVGLSPDIVDGLEFTYTSGP